MVPVDGVEKLTFKDDNTVETTDATYNHESGIVTLIDIWVQFIV
jgi:hypothetical protein